MLKLIGMGIGTEKGLTLEAIEEAKSCDYCYIELYTNPWNGSLEGLEKIVGKVFKLDRKGVEEGDLVEKAKKNSVALLVPGDPLAATTHIELLLEAKKAGIDTKVVHASSIFSAIGETGLQLYKFGRTVTIPSDRIPESVRDVINKNKEMGLHTLLLLDPGLSVEKALEMLDFQEKVVVAHFGERNRFIYANPKDIKNFPEPAVIVVVGDLHFKEKEYLEMLK